MSLPRPEPVPPGPGQESAWDYPRPPRIEAIRAQVEVIFGGRTIAITLEPLRVLETGHPPTWYLPPGGVVTDHLVPSGHSSYCEFKGAAALLDVVVGTNRAADGAWTYRRPFPGFEALAGYVAFYPGRMEACLLDGELVLAQPGDFYGGWISTDVVGPFKGGPGTEGW